MNLSLESEDESITKPKMIGETVGKKKPALKYSITTGAILGLKLALSYSIFIALLLSIATFNPIIFLLTIASALMFGLIPSVLVGSLAGLILGSVFSWSRNSLSEWKVVSIGWALGIFCALLLPLIVVIMTDGINISVSEIIESIRGFGLLLTCPSVITIFAIGWLARKIGEPFFQGNESQI